MTDTPMNLTSACDELARATSWLPRVRTALIEGQHDRARHLLVSAMREQIDVWASDPLTLRQTPTVADACKVANASPGPLVFSEMRAAARRELDRIVGEYGYPLEGEGA